MQPAAAFYEGRSINKLQNGAIPLILKIGKIRNIRLPAAVYPVCKCTCKVDDKINIQTTVTNQTHRLQASLQHGAYLTQWLSAIIPQHNHIKLYQSGQINPSRNSSRLNKLTLLKKLTHRHKLCESGVPVCNRNCQKLNCSYLTKYVVVAVLLSFQLTSYRTYLCISRAILALKVVNWYNIDGSEIVLPSRQAMPYGVVIVY